MVEAAPPVRFLRLQGGMRLAYAVHGRGPALVCPAWWVSHLEEDWQDEGFRALFSGLAQHHTVVRYDRLGSGLSDRERERADLDEEVAILEQLVDHLELARVSLFAVSCAGPPALRYCAEHPDRVDRLVFFGSFLRGADVGPQPMKEAMQGLVRAHWGMGSRAITQLFAPNLETEGVQKVSRAHRRAASPEMAAQLLSLTFDVDAHSVAASVTAPALVLHRKRDQTIRLSAGRELAASLAHADLVTLEGDAHVPWIGDVDGVRTAILEFLGTAPVSEAARSEPEGPRLHKQGELWALSWDGSTVHLKDARGLSDLAILLRRPGEAVHVATLWSGAESAAMGGSEDPVLDDEALASYRGRFEQLGELLEQAKAHGDAAGATKLEEEREALAKELRGAVGLGGRTRSFTEPSQRARKAVSARIRASIKKIEAVHPALATHLDQSISTGMSCSYDPDLRGELGRDHRLNRSARSNLAGCVLGTGASGLKDKPDEHHANRVPQRVQAILRKQAPRPEHDALAAGPPDAAVRGRARGGGHHRWRQYGARRLPSPRCGPRRADDRNREPPRCAAVDPQCGGW